jgi:hypothetical protein
MNVQIINPITYQGWDQLLLTNHQSTFFHTAHWARVLHESYNYKPLYFTLIENSKLKILLPVMEINSFLTGKRGVSLPFTDACPPIAHQNRQFKELLQHVCEHGKKAGWRHIELRGAHKELNPSPFYSTHYSHLLELDQDHDKIFSSFKSNVRRNIKRAQKERLQVTHSNTWKAVTAFCRLNCMTRKQHGLPPQPLSFFKNVFKHIISAGNGFVALAVHQKKPVAAAVFFHHGNQGMYKYGASDPKYRNLRPNNLIMWEAIRWYCRNRYKTLCLGRTEPENKGLLQFKRAWGTIENPMHYYRYDLIRNCFVSKRAGLKSSYNVFKHIPVPILRFTGNILYRHVG